MNRPTLAEWLKEHVGTKPAVGQNVFVIYDNMKELAVQTQRIKKIGHKFITLYSNCDRRFGVTDTDAPYLEEDTEYGRPRRLYFDKDEADDVVRKYKAMRKFRQDYEKWLRRADSHRILAAIAILDGSASGILVERVLESLEKWPEC